MNNKKAIYDKRYIRIFFSNELGVWGWTNSLNFELVRIRSILIREYINYFLVTFNWSISDFN